jgi:hypothetical protein
VDLFTSKTDSSAIVNDEFTTLNSDTYRFNPSATSFDLMQGKQSGGKAD